MTTHYKHNPLGALAESDAVGETARAFEDIRGTMGIPWLTSIWRTLAGIDAGLSTGWNATRPIFESGLVEPALERIRQQASLPRIRQQASLPRLGSPIRVSLEARAVLDAYNRSNGMNLLALSGLVASPLGQPDQVVARDVPSWPKLPALLTEADVTPDTWSLINDLNQFGAQPDQPGLATLWRHLGHWPELLREIKSGLKPLQQDGTIGRTINGVLDLAEQEGRRLAHFKGDPSEIPETALEMISAYVRHPGLVVRMVVIGFGVAGWLETEETTP